MEYKLNSLYRWRSKKGLRFNGEFPKLPDAELMQKYVINFDKKLLRSRKVIRSSIAELVANGLLAE